MMKQFSIFCRVMLLGIVCTLSIPAFSHNNGEESGAPYEAVDLGLSVKWATCNVGATAPEQCGGYYAWGETEEKKSYEWSTYKWCNGSADTMTKYCAVDNKTVLDPEDDVAHVKWGGSWRMPTKAELDELRDKCTWSWTTRNGVKGYKVTGPNGNCIFLPVTGYRYGAGIHNRTRSGIFWPSSLSCDDSSYAYYLYFDDEYYDGLSYHRYYGHTVRPVCE